MEQETEQGRKQPRTKRVLRREHWVAVSISWFTIAMVASSTERRWQPVAQLRPWLDTLFAGPSNLSWSRSGKVTLLFAPLTLHVAYVSYRWRLSRYLFGHLCMCMCFRFREWTSVRLLHRPDPGMSSTCIPVSELSSALEE